MGTMTVGRAWSVNNASAADHEHNRADPSTARPTLAPHRIHQRCIVALVKLLDPYLESPRLGVTIIGTSEPDPEGEALSPDVAVLAADDGLLSPICRNEDRLLLAVEVLSPATARCDRLLKRITYLQMGAVYWIIDPDARLVERWLPCARRPDIIDDELFWFPEGATQPLLIDVETYFDSVFRCFAPPVSRRA